MKRRPDSPDFWNHKPPFFGKWWRCPFKVHTTYLWLSQFPDPESVVVYWWGLHRAPHLSGQLPRHIETFLLNEKAPR